MELVAVRVRVLARPGLAGDLRQGRVLDQQGGRIDADAGDAPVEPEPQDVLVLGANVGVVPVQVRLLGGEQVQVPLAGRAVRVRVSASRCGPEKFETQWVGISSPSRPGPGRNQKRARSGEPGPAASAAWNHGCWSETWFGTMSTMVRMPSASASAMRRSASSSVPNAGSMAR